MADGDSIYAASCGDVVSDVNLVGTLAAKAMQQAAQSGVNITELAASAANATTADTVRNATTVMSMLPIMMVYPFLQKYFAKGIMIGAVKG